MLATLLHRYRNQAIAVGVGASVALGFAALALARPAVLARWEGVAYDGWEKRAALQTRAPADVVLIDVTDADLRDVEDNLGMSWPWRREIFGHLVRFASRAGAKAVVFDWIFEDLRGATDDQAALAEPMRECGCAVLGVTMPRARGDDRRRSVEGPWAARLAHLPDRPTAERVAMSLQAWALQSFLVPAGEGIDLYVGGRADEEAVLEDFARVSEEPPVQALFKEIGAAEPRPRALEERELASALDVRQAVMARAMLPLAAGDSTRLPLRNDFSPPSAALAAAASRLGSVSQLQDADQIFRRHFPLLAHDGKLFPSLSLAALLQAAPQTRVLLEDQDLVLGERRIALDEEGGFGIRFNDRNYVRFRAYEVLRALKLLQKGESPELPMGAFRDKVVFIVPAAAALKDLRTTAVGTALGAEVNVAAYDGLARGRTITRVGRWLDAGVGLALALLLVLGVAAIWARCSSWAVALAATSVLVAGAMVGLWWTGAALLASADLWIAFVAPASGCFVAVLATIAVSNALESQDRRFAEEAVGRYTSPVILGELKKHRERLSLDWGEQREVSVYFSDIADFTSFSEALEPKKLVRLLNDYLTHMTDIVLAHDGVVDKYIGDAIMAFWGAPLDEPEHARKAVLSALAMRRRCEELRERWLRDFNTLVIARAGINTGPAIAGHMGSKHKFNFTLIGDTVNLASRLEGANKPYGTTLMVSEACLAATGGAFEARELDLLAVKGKQKPVRVFEILGEKGKMAALLAGPMGAYHEALRLYRERDFARAQAAFEGALRMKPDDGPSKMYLGRCKYLIDHPPETDWDGVWRMKEK